MASKEVATKADSAVAALDFGSNVGQGFENQTSDDVAIPFFKILQPLSPAVVEGLVPGAAAGMLHNSVTDEVFDGEEGIEFVPAITDHVYVEWTPLDSGGGLVGHHAIDSDVVTKAKANFAFNELKTDAGNDLIDTFYVYGVVVEPNGALTPATIAFTSTKIKAYKGIMNRLRKFTYEQANGELVTPNLYNHRLRITTVKQQKGPHTFFNIVLRGSVENQLERGLIGLDDIRSQEAQRVYELFLAGKTRTEGESNEDAAATPRANVAF